MRLVEDMSQSSPVLLSAGSERIRHSVASQSYVENSRRKLQNVLVNNSALFLGHETASDDCSLSPRRTGKMARRYEKHGQLRSSKTLEDKAALDQSHEDRPACDVTGPTVEIQLVETSFFYGEPSWTIG